MATLAPTLNTIISKDQRKAAGVSSFDYVDAYNQSAMAQYNNEYNYWLWQQQMEYNTPAAQVARLKEAGLNPNYNSIDGTGNATSIPSSSGSISPSVASNHYNRVNSLISSINAIFSNVGDTLNAYQTAANSPMMTAEGFKAYRNAVNTIVMNNANISRLNYEEKSALRAWDMAVKGMTGNSGEGYQIDTENSIAWKAQEGKINQTAAQEAMYKATEALKKYDLDNLKPQELANMKETLRYIAAGAHLREMNYDWYNAKSGAAMIFGFLSAMSKFLPFF